MKVIKKKIIKAIIIGVLVTGALIPTQGIIVSATEVQKESKTKMETPKATDFKITPTTNRTSKDGSISKVSGNFDGFEYSIDGGTKWLNPTKGQNQITGLAVGKVYIRQKETSEKLASDPVVLEVGSKEKKEQDKPDKATMQNYGFIKKDVTKKGGNDGELSNLPNGMEYSLDKGKNWTDVKDNKITGLKAGNVYLRYKETDEFKASPHIVETISEPTDDKKVDDKKDDSSKKPDDKKKDNKNNDDQKTDDNKDDSSKNADDNKNDYKKVDNKKSDNNSGSPKANNSNINQNKPNTKSNNVSKVGTKEPGAVKAKAESQSDKKKDSKAVKTSDTSSVGFIIGCIASCLVMILMAVTKIRKLFVRR